MGTTCSTCSVNEDAQHSNTMSLLGTQEFGGSNKKKKKSKEHDNHNELELDDEKSNFKIRLSQDFSEIHFQAPRLKHNFVNLPGVSMNNLTGNILTDINAMWNEKIYLAPIKTLYTKHDSVMTTYKDLIIKDAYFENNSQISPLSKTTGNFNNNNNDNNNKSSSNPLNDNNNNGGTHFSFSYANKLCTFEEIVKFKLIKFESQWNATHEYLIGAHLIERAWMKCRNSKNNILSMITKSIQSAASVGSDNEENIGDDNDDDNKDMGIGMEMKLMESEDDGDGDGDGDDDNLDNEFENDGFMIMQFNMLADCLSGAYLEGIANRKENNKFHEKYSKCFYNTSEYCLQWKYRGLRLAEELLRYECDIS